ncbi:TPA: VanZ family protein [Streptococcus suis]|nr:VanZ family protein [Streptococcus suis]HEM6221592.1 VanZ family protein [Streptococcus suis]HEM6302453.1 VanZ family protein [Streptococcus suis]HEM6304014.1 VanZ family protein [Streptococcus suis]HEM6339198.1 VanZ family protein [Streptococcus suis]
MQSRIISILLFLTYLLLLTWMIVFKMDLSVLYGRYDSAQFNLIPLAGTAVYNGILNFPEILFNIISFIPFGIYMEMLFRKASWVSNLLLILLVSFLFEVTQYLLLLGIADITDFLANGLGGAIGINIMYVLTSIWHEKAYARMNVFCFLLTLFIMLTTYFLV